MKFSSIVLVLIVSSLVSFAQKSKLSIFKESKISIINFDVDKDPNSLPIITLTILNKTKESIIFNRIALNLTNFKKNPTSASSGNYLTSKALSPIAGLDMTMPYEENTYIYKLTSPIEIVSKDAATIKIRIHCDFNNKIIVPSQLGVFKFSLLFITYDFKAIKSSEIILGDN